MFSQIAYLLALGLHSDYFSQIGLGITENRLTRIVFWIAYKQFKHLETSLKFSRGLTDFNSAKTVRDRPTERCV